MTLKQIKFRIQPDGTIKTEVLGAMGNECLKTTEPIERSVGVVMDRKYLASFFVTEPTVQEKRIQLLEDEDWRGCCEGFGCAL